MLFRSHRLPPSVLARALAAPPPPRDQSTLGLPPGRWREIGHWLSPAHPCEARVAATLARAGSVARAARVLRMTPRGVRYAAHRATEILAHDPPPRQLALPLSTTD